MNAWLEETTFNIDNSKAISHYVTHWGWLGGKKKNILIIPQRGKQKALFSTKDLIGGQTCIPIH